jgi:hypothetical protein
MGMRMGLQGLASGGTYTRTYLSTLDDHSRAPVLIFHSELSTFLNSVRNFCRGQETPKIEGKKWLVDV